MATRNKKHVDLYFPKVEETKYLLLKLGGIGLILQKTVFRLQKVVKQCPSLRLTVFLNVLTRDLGSLEEWRRGYIADVQ